MNHTDNLDHAGTFAVANKIVTMREQPQPESSVTEDLAQFRLIREKLDRPIAALEPLPVDYRVRYSRKWRRSRQALRERVQFDAASAPSPAGASGNPTATAPDDVLNIEFTGRSGVEALLDFRL